LFVWANGSSKRKSTSENSHQSAPKIGLVAPANTPRDIIVRLNKEIVEILKDKESAEELLKQGAIPVADSPEEFAAYIKVEIAKWGAVVKSANIKPD
jgi:tripartite-type tricarboxylate transporter receptor subunit TctC